MYCPSCSRQIEHGSRFCRFCGATIAESVIEADRIHAQQARAAALSYGTPKLIPRAMLAEGERLLFEVNPHMVYTLLLSWILAALFAMAGIASAYFVFEYADARLAAITGACIEIIALLAFLLPYMRWRYTIYALSTGRAVRVKGIIRKDAYECPLARIQDLRLRIGILQRLFRCGDIMVTTAGTGSIECVWANISRPWETQKTLRSMLGRQ